MNTPREQQSLEDLCQEYQYAWMLKFAKRKFPEHNYAWKIETLEKDMEELFENMKNKIPASHILEVEQIKLNLLQPTNNIQEGQWYHHPGIPHLRIQVIDQDKATTLWVCRMFIGKIFVCRVYLKTEPIVNSFKLFDPCGK